MGERHEARRGRADLGDREVDHHLPIKYDQKFVQFVQLAEQFKVARVCKGLCEDNFSDKLNFSMKLCNNATSWNRILIKIKIYWIQHTKGKNFQIFYCRRYVGSMVEGKMEGKGGLTFKKFLIDLSFQVNMTHISNSSNNIKRRDDLA